MQNLKRDDTDELTKQRDSQTQRMNLWLLGGRGNQRDWDEHVHTAIFKIDNQQGPSIQHMKLSAQCLWQPGWEGNLGRIYMYG